MCGIAALLAPLPEKELERRICAMLQAQSHRGPDDRGWTVIRRGDAGIAVGNCRLAIQDVSPLGHQPMQNPDTGDLLVYNGEIYNTPELRTLLQSAGYAFQGRSDTEVLLRAYQHWGVSSLDRLRGMFAFVLWDAQRSRLLLARDHVGIKPLYYFCKDGAFACASEIRALSRSGLFPAEIDRRALAGYLGYGGVQEPLTIYRNVFALPRGSWRELSTTGDLVAQGTYWSFPFPDRAARRRPIPELLEEGRVILKRSVERHLLSDVRLGVFLSSGLDSTAVLGLGCATGAPIEAFNVSFPDHARFDEQRLARATAARFGARFHDCPVTDSDVQAWISDALDGIDQPSLDGLNTYIVARAVRQRGIVVALSGLGGDEIFGGYNLFRRVPRAYFGMTWLSLLPRSARCSAASVLTTFAGAVARCKAQEIVASDPGLIGLYFRHRRLISDCNLSLLGFTPSELGLSDDLQVRSLDYRDSYVGSDHVASVARLDAAFYLQNILLRDSDVFGMANSLEIRVPFLDRDVLEWAFRLPGDVFLPRRAPKKYLLRKMCAALFDPVQLNQSKRGFVLPIADWLRSPLRELMEQNIATLRASGLLNPAGIEAVTEMFWNEPNGPAWSRAWALLTLGHWIRSQPSTQRAVRPPGLPEVCPYSVVATGSSLGST